MKTLTALLMFSLGGSASASTATDMAATLRLFYRGVRTGKSCLVSKALAPRGQLEEGTLLELGRPDRCVLGFRVVRSTPVTERRSLSIAVGGPEVPAAEPGDLEVLASIVYEARCHVTADQRTFVLTNTSRGWRIKWEMWDWPPNVSRDLGRGGPYESVTKPLPGEARMCAATRQGPRHSPPESGPRIDPLALATKDVIAVARRVEASIRSRDVVGIMRYASREGIPCPTENVTYAQAEQELRTADTEFHAYLFDARVFSERYVQPDRPISLAQFFWEAKETDIRVIPMAEKLDVLCAMFMSTESKARPTICFRRADEGWVFAGAPFSIYPCNLR